MYVLKILLCVQMRVKNNSVKKPGLVIMDRILTLIFLTLKCFNTNIFNTIILKDKTTKNVKMSIKNGVKNISVKHPRKPC